MNHEILENNLHSLIIALSETELGKVVLPDCTIWKNQNGEVVDMKALFGSKDRTVKDEAENLQYANAINDLMPKFIRQDKWLMQDGTTADMLVMERLYILPNDHFELSVREKMLVRFENQMKELHNHLFVHGDFIRPTSVYTRNNYEWMFQNIVQTATGLRLIDAGFAEIYDGNNAKDFAYVRYREQQEIKIFRKYYLGEIKSKPFQW